MCRELNPQPLEHELSPITTRPGLPPNKNVSILCSVQSFFYERIFSLIGAAIKPRVSMLNTNFKVAYLSHAEIKHSDWLLQVT